MTSPRASAPWLALPALLFTAQSMSAPLGTVRIENEGRTTSLELHTAGAAVRVRRSDDATWTLVVTAEGPRLVTGAASASTTACDSTLFATLAMDDTDGDGRIEPARGERVRLLAAANWRAGDAWQSAVVVLDLTSGAATLAWQRDSRTLPALGRLTAAPTVLHASGSARERSDALLVASGWPRDSAPGGRGQLLSFDARSGTVLPSMFEAQAHLVSGVSALDRDGDGATDRLYLADADWRVWRLERAVRASGPPRFDASLLADLSSMAEPGAALQLTPDVALNADGASAFLEIAMGTSNIPSRASARHWLFVLRDAPGSTPLPPILPADLLRVGELPAETRSAAQSRGLRMPLSGPLAASVLTVAGHRVIATRTSATPDRCAVRIVESEMLQVTVLTPALELVSRIVVAETDARLSLSVSASGGRGPGTALLECRLGSVLLPQCPRMSRVTRDYWLRRDSP